MKRVLAFGAIGALGMIALGGIARAQEFPWLFAGGTTDIAAIVDEDGDGPDLTDDCYFKFTGQPSLSGNMTFKFVDASGMNCHSPFPCTGSFTLTPGANAVITIDSCTGSLSIPTPFVTTFSRPGPPPVTDALLSPNTGSTSSDPSTAVSVLFCESEGLAAQVTLNGMIAALLPLEFFPDAANPTFLKVPFLGEAVGGTGDVFIPLTGRRATIASQSVPGQIAAELNFGALCDCSLGGMCPTGVNPAPAASGWGLAVAAFALLVVGSYALRRRPHFGAGLPLP